MKHFKGNKFPKAGENKTTNYPFNPDQKTIIQTKIYNESREICRANGFLADH